MRRLPPRSARLVVGTLALVAACASRQKWEGGPTLARPELIAQEFSPLLMDKAPQVQCANIPMPVALRPCCAFGSGLQVQLGSMPVPLLSLANVIGLEDLGRHQYDHGFMTLHESRVGGGLLNSERNGLIYTCRGGFVDTAHLREWADWTLYLSALIGRSIETGAVVDLPDEGGSRRIVIHAMDPQRVAQYGVSPLAVPLAQWLAFQLSLWHEIATWYGWSATAFSEEASAFSPEDLYSNLLGIKAAAVLIYQSNATSQAVYDENMSAALPRLLQRLGAVSGDVGRAAMQSVDQVWWDSNVRLPDKRLLRRRFIEAEPQITPWLVNRGWSARDENATVYAACADTEAIVLQNPTSFAELPFASQATIEIEMSPGIAARMHRTGSRRITQNDYPALLEAIRAENQRELGSAANGPAAP